MSELIDREKLIIDLIDSKNEHAQNSREESLLDRDIRIVKEQSKADGKVHGHWIFKESTGGGFTDPVTRYVCSKCGKVSEMICDYISMDDFCKNCGAKMDEDTEGENEN